MGVGGVECVGVVVEGEVVDQISSIEASHSTILHDELEFALRV